MKKTLSLTIAAFLSLSLAFAQQQPLQYLCGTDEHEQDMQREFPEQHARRMELEKQVQALVESGAAQRMSQTLRVIPVVVHVISDDGAGISKAQIEDGIAILNRDYRRWNADTVNTRPIFKQLGADFELEFRLAKLDPNGNCTEGIVRVANPAMANAPNPRNLVKGVSYWPSNQYLNVWLVNTIYGTAANGAGIAGYAQFPGSGAANTYGFVNRHDYWGSIGTAANSGGRTPTHEIGHCLNLFHTFESFGSGNGCGSSCNNSGDNVCDTPPAALPTSVSSCNTNLNSCSNDTQGPGGFTTDVVDQTENYMSYDYCQNLFTTGQKNRVLASFATYSFLQDLTSQANAIATGTNDGYVAVPCAPVAFFRPNLSRICANSPVTFSDYSYNATVDSTWTWTWSFPGAVPATSTVQNPTVTYATPGMYNATLIVSNSRGSDTLTRTSIVKVSPVTGGAVAPFTEGFEDPAFPVSSLGAAHDWEIINAGSSGWNRSLAAAFQGVASMRVNNLSIPAGNRNTLISSTIDMSSMQSVKLEFDLAYALRNANNVDKLFVYTSVNCGQSWQLKYTKTGAALSTTNGANQPNFIPSGPADWRHEIVNLAGTAGQSNVLVKLEVESDAGNNLFVDNVQISGTVLSTPEALNDRPVTLFPNPVLNETMLGFYLPKATTVSCRIQDVLGRELASKTNYALNAGEQQLPIGELVESLPSGVYLLQLVQEEKAVTLRFTKN